MSDAPPRVSGDELLARLMEDRLKRFASRFGKDALAWLALAPRWTEPAAAAIAFPRPRNTPLPQFLDEAFDHGLVSRDPPLRVDPEFGRGFWISESVREPVLDFLRRPDEFGPVKLTEATVQIARQLDEARASTPLPDELRYWSDLARSARAPEEAARQLGDAVAALTRDPRDQNTGEALARVDAGKSLARSLGSTHLEDAIGLGSRRIGLAYRQAADDRYLRGYFHRQEQEEAFTDLLDQRSPAWALHYLGVGGAGKTMLLRWITTPQNGDGTARRDRVVARIDFDELKPEYPVRKPGQLLLDLAVELRAFGRSSHEDQLFKTIEDTVKDLHATLGTAPPAANPLANVERPEFDKILRSFCDLLRVLPPPVVLILDTCEELARVPVAKGMLPSVEATFSILERVHQTIPSVRIVFAGRRPLASSGCDWELESESEGATRQHGFRQFLKPRPYLALHEVRGVSKEEAHAFLEKRLGHPLADDLDQAVFARSRDQGRAAEVRYTGSKVRSVIDEPRYSLFDLALYADWLREDPSLDAKRIAEGTSDPYVDLRIVQRVKQPLIRAALPAVAALGRFDAPMLRGAFPASLSDAEYEGIYRELGDYEWIDLQRESGSSNKLFLEIDRNLLPRIREYYLQRSRRGDAEDTIAGLVPTLSSFIRGTRLGDLSVNHISAALAIMPPADAARLWIEILLRVRAQADAAWLTTTTERLMGVEFETARHGPLARGLSLAATAIGFHTSGTAPMPGVDRPLQPWPDEATAEWMTRCTDAMVPSRVDHLLATFTFVPRAADPVVGPDPMPADVLARRLSEEEAASILSSLEYIAGSLGSITALDNRNDGPEGIGALADAVGKWASELHRLAYPDALVGPAQLLTAKLWAAAWHIKEADEWAAMALDTANRIDGEAGGVWLFWRSPMAPCDRIRHELLLLNQDVPLETFPNPRPWLAGALARNVSIDGERLASAIEGYRLDRAVPDAGELALTRAADKYVVERLPVTAAHRRTPALFITVALQQAALGEFEAADTTLQTRALAAEASHADPETVWNATLARVDVACASRSVPRELPSLIGRLTRDVKEQAPARNVFALRALTGHDVTDGFIGTAHDSGRTWVPSEGDREQMLERLETVRRIRLPRREVAPKPQPLPLADALDTVEGLRLAMRTELTPGGVPESTHVRDRDDLVRGMLRLFALDPIPEAQLGASVELSVPLAVLLLGRSHGNGMLVPRSVLTDAIRRMASALDQGPPAPVASVIAAREGTEDMPSRLLDFIGLRQLAATAREEGELLALRLPGEGLRLLHLATSLAEAARDAQTALAGATAATLASIRTAMAPGDPSDLRMENGWVTAAGAPGWQAIEAAADDIASDPRGVEKKGPPAALPARGGWVPRAVLALVARRTRDTASRWVLARDRVPMRFPDQAMAPEITLTIGHGAEPFKRVDSEPGPSLKTDSTNEFPPALIALCSLFALAMAVLWIYCVRINAFGATGTPTPSTTRYFWPLIWTAAALGAITVVGGTLVARIVVGFTVAMFGFLAVMYSSSVWIADVVLTDRLVAGPLTQSWQVAFMFVVMTLLVAVQPTLRRLRARAVHRSDALVTVGSTSSRADLRAEVGATSALTLQVSCTARWLPFPFYSERASRWRHLTEVSALKPYAASAAAIPLKDVELLPQIRARLDGVIWPVPVFTGAASYYAWEGLLGLALGPNQSDGTPRRPRPPSPPLKEPVFFYRWGPARSTERPDVWAAGRVDVVGATSHDIWIDRVILRASTNWLGIGSPLRDPIPTIVHAIGTPVMTSAGPRLDIGGDRVLDAHMLRDGLPLLVIQQQPSDSQARLTSDREQAALLRAVAADLFDSTCEAVIVVPALPPELADRVMKSIARSLSARSALVHAVSKRFLEIIGERRGADLALARLAGAVRTARDLVFEWNGFEQFAAALEERSPSASAHLREDDRWEGHEVAWDLCLFARPRDPRRALVMDMFRSDRG